MGANTASLNKRGKFDKSLIAVIMPLAWPTILEQALQTIVQFIDSAMVGRISANASAAVGLTQTVTWLLSGLFFAAGVGFLAVISRAIGADDRDYAQRTAGQAVVVAVIMGLVIGAAGMALSFVLPTWLGGAEEIRRDATIYFFIINVPMVFRSAIILFGALLRATGDMRHPMLVNAMMNAINVVLNFFLIYSTRSVSLFGVEVTIPGAGMAVMAASRANIQYLSGLMDAQMISCDKINQLRQVRFLKDKAHTLELMQRHAALLRPRFDAFLTELEKLRPLEIARWTQPQGGYFISLYTLPGCAKRTVELCRQAGLVMTQAGATYPYGKDPEDRHIRIAPSYPALEDVKTAAKVFCTCLKLAALEKQNLVN